MSPEIRNNKDHFDGHAVDVWALGPILFIMVTGCPPFKRASQDDDNFKSISKGYLSTLVRQWNLDLSADLVDLLQRMLYKKPRRRLSLEQVRAHKWMRGNIQQPHLDLR